MEDLKIDTKIKDITEVDQKKKRTSTSQRKGKMKKRTTPSYVGAYRSQTVGKKKRKTKGMVVVRKKKIRKRKISTPHVKGFVQQEIIVKRKKKKTSKKKKKKRKPNFSVDITATLPSYNPLMDHSLSNFFQKRHYRNQLENNYLVDKKGRILNTSSNGQSIRIIQKEFERLQKQQKLMNRERVEEKRKEVAEKRKRKEMRYRKLKVELQRRNLMTRLLKKKNSVYINVRKSNTARNPRSSKRNRQNKHRSSMTLFSNSKKNASLKNDPKRPMTSYQSRKSDPLIVGENDVDVNESVKKEVDELIMVNDNEEFEEEFESDE